MDNQMMLSMMSSMLEKMSDNEVEIALQRAKSMVSANDYEKLKKLVYDRRFKKTGNT